MSHEQEIKSCSQTECETDESNLNKTAGINNLSQPSVVDNCDVQLINFFISPTLAHFQALLTVSTPATSLNNIFL